MYSDRDDRFMRAIYPSEFRCQSRPAGMKGGDGTEREGDFVARVGEQGGRERFCLAANLARIEKGVDVR